DDVRRLAGRVSDRWPDRARRVVVVGVRTSGSYLAPLAAAALRAGGHEQVDWTTLRPGQRWLPREQHALARAAGAGALVVLMDDPPISWGSVARAARLLTATGFPAGSVVLALQTFDASAPPDGLRAHPAVLMPWEEWQVHARLEPGPVREALSALLGPGTPVGRVVRVGTEDGPTRRGHVHARFEVEVGVSAAGRAVRREVRVRGVGLGYLGAHSLAVSGALEGFLPAVHGVRDGLMFRDWVPEVDRLTDDTDEELVAGAVARYVDARARSLRTVHDTSRRLSRRATVAGRAAEVVSRGFGRAHGLAWPFCVRAMRPLLEVREPSVVDGNTALDAWFLGGSSGLVKVGADERAFCSLDLHSYDPVFDLAGAAGGGSPSLADALRRHYGELAGSPVAPERWLLHQLVHLREGARHGEDAQVERRMSAAVQRYAGEVLLADVVAPDSGELCALDVDGVLEASRLGFSVIDRAGARALRALVLHGRRPVLATGRSVDDVRERCRHYRLAGGVAEYGAALVVAASREVVELLGDGDRERLAAVRAAAVRLPGVELDAAYQRSVRAHRRDASGRRRGLTPQQVEQVLSVTAASGPIRAIPGLTSTDFMVAEVTKATGLRALGEHLGAPGGIALAVGDSLADLEMLRLARLGCAPRNAERALRDAGVRVMRRPYQPGLEEAVALLLGHRPGACPVCREPRLTPDARLLLALLGEPRSGSTGVRIAASVAALGRIAVAAARAHR
ncbi:MAG TPA: HAD hydrolase family protein, partial [Candidatus Dormibacteraeota bacterium]|nr:HAD hydrolase family protein [Candidatus Dormibacteraeota bacterium]